MKFKLERSFIIFRTLGTYYPPRKGMRVVYNDHRGSVCGTVVEPEYRDEDLGIICSAIEFDEGEATSKMSTHTCNGRVPSKRGWIVARENWGLLSEIQER